MKTKITITALYMLLILMTSVIPMESHVNHYGFVLDLKPTIQNMLHIPVFAILAILLTMLLQNCGLSKCKELSLVLIICVGFGALNEIIQTFVPGRYGDLLDTGLNAIGSVVGIAVYFIALEMKKIITRADIPLILLLISTTSLAIVYDS